MSTHRIKTGDYDVIASGTVITFGDQPTEIFFGETQKLSLKFVFLTEGIGMKMESVQANENSLELRLFNFNQGLNQGNLEPIRIGDENGKEVFLSFRSSRLNQSASRTLEYTIYKHV